MQVHASKLVAKLGAIDELINRGPSGDIKERNSIPSHIKVQTKFRTLYLISFKKRGLC